MIQLPTGTVTFLFTGIERSMAGNATPLGR
jgi:hypothetical protein